MKRLTDEQRARAEIGYDLAEMYARMFHRPGLDCGVLLSQAAWGLMEAAWRFDPERSPSGEDGWRPFAALQIKRTLLRLWKPYSRDRLWVQPCGLQDEGVALDSAPDHRDCGLRLDAAEEVAAGMAALSGRERDILWAVHALGEPAKDVARAHGVSVTRAFEVRRNAERKFRRARLCRHGEAS